MDQFYTAVVYGASAKASGSPLDTFRVAAEACGASEQWFGSTPEEKAQVASWLQIDVTNTQRLVGDMERVLESSSFLASAARVTAADVYIYSVVQSQATGLSANVSRWLSTVQGFVSQSTGISPAQLHSKPEALRPVLAEETVVVAAAAAPAVKDKAAIGKEKKAAAEAANAKSENKPEDKKREAAPAAAAVAPAAAPTTEEEPKKKKAATEEPKKEKKPVAAPAAASADFLPLFLDVKVGKILSCEKHKEADTLYVETIDLGEPTGPRQICSGLVKYYAEASLLVGKSVLVVCNLKPRTMVGVESNGMVLACSNADKTEVKLVEVPEGAVPGDAIQYQGYAGPAVEPMQPNQVNKKKVLETVMPGWKTDVNGNVNWTDLASGTVYPLQVKGQSCTGGGINNGTVG
ncbi:hypothetical protein BASA81_003926 [Batrachochytrium salamandrivorans]|nr:hypothetical protein BASA81_003926 [Batrachochytrium salamandrivorans]